ncbi:glycerophosphoryl diester phosphodiesterase membrane domain-containing protein [Streptomyces sp. NPDC000410]|uniref:glycerophosphoryl diester phosphodiesterase membrane domain-containing protein n=1 Tax=Streptomyces sp. NPDC000410 TaxID=3154254 RepID=UPI00333059E5
MNDTPGWASPGSAPSDDQGSGVPRPADAAGPGPKWSKEQPPAGQWASPTAPGGGSVPPPVQPGWTGGPQHGGWGQPPAAKPGVIPLRPLGVGEILDGAVSTLRAHWRTVLGVTVTVSVITQIAEILAQRYLVPKPPAINPDASTEEALAQTGEAMRSSLVGLSPSLVITLIGTLFTTALLTVVISRSVVGRPVTLSEAWRESRPRLPHLLGLMLLLLLLSVGVMALGILPGVLLGSVAGVGLAVLGGLAGCVVAIWLWVRFALASPALMLERQGVLQSMRRSAKLVNGAWWRTFGILALTVLLAFVVAMVIAVPFSLIAYAVDGESFSGLLSGRTPDFGWPFLIITGIGAVIASSITYPISAGVTVLLYIDQRIRREALDLELARAAGISGYGPPAAGDDTSRS